MWFNSPRRPILVGLAPCSNHQEPRTMRTSLRSRSEGLPASLDLSCLQTALVAVRANWVPPRSKSCLTQTATRAIHPCRRRHSGCSDCPRLRNHSCIVCSGQSASRTSAPLQNDNHPSIQQCDARRRTTKNRKLVPMRRLTLLATKLWIRPSAALASFSRRSASCTPLREKSYGY